MGVVGRFERWFFFLGGGAEERRVVPLLVRVRDRDREMGMGIEGIALFWIRNCFAPLQGWLPQTQIRRFIIALLHFTQLS